MNFGNSDNRTPGPSVRSECASHIALRLLELYSNYFFSTEVLQLPFLLLAIYGMYNGIEISHPVYSVLFLDLIVCLMCTGESLYQCLYIYIYIALVHVAIKSTTQPRRTNATGHKSYSER